MLLPRSISSAVSDISSRVAGKDWSLYDALFRHWREIAGDEYADASAPFRISVVRDGKPDAGGKKTVCRRLHISLPRGLMTDFTFAKPRMLERIAACLGQGVVSDIVLEPLRHNKSGAKRPGGGSVKKAQALPQEWNGSIEDGISDAGLRDALQNLGKYVLGNGK